MNRPNTHTYNRARSHACVTWHHLYCASVKCVGLRCLAQRRESDAVTAQKASENTARGFWIMLLDFAATISLDYLNKRFGEF